MAFRRRSRLNLAVVLSVTTYLCFISRYTTSTYTSTYAAQWSGAALKERLHKAASTSAWWHRGSHDSMLDAVSNSTLGYQEIFVVNLPLRTDRSDTMALAASLTGLKLTFVPGVDGTAIDDRALPADSKHKHITPGQKGCWRAHINVLRRIVEQNITTALIMEDDIDWDVRIKAQMGLFALASQAYSQPSRGSNLSFAAARQQTPSSMGTVRQEPRKGQAMTTNDKIPPQKFDFPLEAVPEYEPPQVSPYGDNWDVLWLGHCGTEVPEPSTKRSDGTIPTKFLLRLLVKDDETVPEPADLRPHPFALPDMLGVDYPPHTRIVHAASGTLCVQAYAVSLRGAQKMLYQLGVASFTTGYDLMLRDWCDGTYREASDAGADMPVCITTQPPLFSHYLRAKDSYSDIQGTGGGFVHRTGSQYIRQSAMRNLGRLANGASFDKLQDQWPGKDKTAKKAR